jgi:hypothetical protein
MGTRRAIELRGIDCLGVAAVLKLPLMLAACVAAASLARAETAPPAHAEVMQAAIDQHHLALADRLAQSRDPRAAYVAAVLLRGPEFVSEEGRVRSQLGSEDPARAARADELFARALREGADDAVLWWMAVADCPASAALCDRREHVEHLRRIAPHNAAVWLIGDKIETDSAADVDARLARAAQASRYDEYAGERFRIFASAVQAVAVDDRLRELLSRETDPALHETALALALFWATPPANLSWFRAQCAGERVAGDVSRGERCLQIAKKLARADEPPARRFAVSLIEVVAPDGAAHRELQRESDIADWQRHAALELTKGYSDVATTLELFGYLRGPGATQTAAHRALLQAHGVALEPPPGWRSDRRPIVPH